MNILSHYRRPAITAGFVAITLGINIAQAQEAPTGDAAFPPFGSCSSDSVPGLPEIWTATALLTPFQSQPMQVAQMAVNADPNYMIAVTNTLPNQNVPTGWFIFEGATYKISAGVDGNMQCIPDPTKGKDWQIPSPNFLANANCTCMGSNEVAGSESEAWRCPNGEVLSHNPQTGQTTYEYDWFWFNKEREFVPQRFLFSRNNNAQELPVIGNMSLNNFTSFSSGISIGLQALANMCLKGGAFSSADVPNPEIEGVYYAQQDEQPATPAWPDDTAFANGALFAIDGTYTSMAIYYDWVNRQEVSKILSSDADMELYPDRPRLADTRLTVGKTYQVSYENGQRVFPTTKAEAKAGGILGNVGTWHPDWPSRDGCEYRATFAQGSPLNPTNDDIQAVTCHFGGTSNLQAWFTYGQQPVMFYETNAGDLDLIDYYTWIPHATIPDGVIYDVPQAVKDLPTQNLGDTCTHCHGAMIGEE